MFFTKDEIIELEDAQYFILDTSIIENEVYYLVQEANTENNELVGEKKIIKAINDQGTLYIDEVKDEDILNKLKETFEL